MQTSLNLFKGLNRLKLKSIQGNVALYYHQTWWRWWRSRLWKTIFLFQMHFKYIDGNKRQTTFKPLSSNQRNKNTNSSVVVFRLFSSALCAIFVIWLLIFTILKLLTCIDQVVNVSWVHCFKDTKKTEKNTVFNINSKENM